MDLVANIRLAYAKAVTNNFMVEVGRTKMDKTYDLNVKYAIFRQSGKVNLPVNISFYSSVAVMTNDFPTIEEGSTFVDNTPFIYKDAHRLVYNNQLIFSRKFSKNFSANLSTVFIWRNLVAEKEENVQLTFPIGGFIRVSPKSAFIAELMPKIGGINKNLPYSIAYQLSSSGAHSFTIIATSSNYVLIQNIATKPDYDISKKYLVLGFNIKRIF